MTRQNWNGCKNRSNFVNNSQKKIQCAKRETPKKKFNSPILRFEPQAKIQYPPQLLVFLASL